MRRGCGRHQDPIGFSFSLYPARRVGWNPTSSSEGSSSEGRWGIVPGRVRCSDVEIYRHDSCSTHACYGDAKLRRAQEVTSPLLRYHINGGADGLRTTPLSSIASGRIWVCHRQLRPHLRDMRTWDRYTKKPHNRTCISRDQSLVSPTSGRPHPYRDT